jgi:hypothetical protein
MRLRQLRNCDVVPQQSARMCAPRDVHDMPVEPLVLIPLVQLGCYAHVESRLLNVFGQPGEEGVEVAYPTTEPCRDCVDKDPQRDAVFAA